MTQPSLNARIILRLLPYLMFVLSLLIAYTIDTKVFPVVRDFTVNTVSRQAGIVTIEGTLLKVRDCDFLGLAVYGLPEKGDKIPLPHWTEDSHSSRGRGVGFQPWGPWRITVPEHPEVRFIEIIATHRCVGPWTQTARYTEFDLRKAP
jgi:hypothetical protein